jgi:hypothetical protein
MCCIEVNAKANTEPRMNTKHVGTLDADRAPVCTKTAAAAVMERKIIIPVVNVMNMIIRPNLSWQRAPIVAAIQIKNTPNV